jgi:hypothetical protein
MSDVTIPRIPKNTFRVEVFQCVDCGVDVVRNSARHFRCEDCRREWAGTYREVEFRARFPVFNPDLEWLCRYLNDTQIEDSATRKRDENKEKRRKERLMADLCGPSPCKECGWAKRCKSEKLACRSFWAWSEKSDNKREGEWGKITVPSGRYYDRCFPRDIRQTGMRRVV